EAVVLIQTSIESFIKSVFIQLAIEENMEDEKIINCLGNYKNLLSHQFKKRIGGNWNIEDSSGELGIYMAKTYELRNRIVHLGYEPHIVESNEALESALKFKEYVLNLLLSKNEKFKGFIKRLY